MRSKKGGALSGVMRVVLGLFALIALVACSSGPERLVIVNPSRHGERITRDMIDILESNLDSGGQELTVSDSGRIPDLEELESFIQFELDEPPDVVVAMTDEAVSIVEPYRDPRSTALVYWAHSHPDALASQLGYEGDIPNATGVALGMSPTSAEDLRMDYLLRLVPDAEDVLVVHNPADTDAQEGLSSLKGVARERGVEVVEGLVRSRADAVDHLELISEVDAVFLAPDRFIGMVAAEYYESARLHRVPLAAPNTSSVVDGALVSYTFSEKSVAQLMAQMVRDVVFAEISPEEFQPQLPEFELAFNLGVAREIGVEPSDAFLQEVDVLLE